jgi:hypothetical protein
VDAKIYGALYQQGVGWVENSIVELDQLGSIDPNHQGGAAIDVSIDGRGNMLALGSSAYQRYVFGLGWLPPVNHSMTLGPWRLWTATSLDGAVLAITHELTSNDEMIPQVARFE